MPAHTSLGTHLGFADAIPNVKYNSHIMQTNYGKPVDFSCATLVLGRQDSGLHIYVKIATLDTKMTEGPERMCAGKREREREIEKSIKRNRERERAEQDKGRLNEQSKKSHCMVCIFA